LPKEIPLPASWSKHRHAGSFRIDAKSGGPWMQRADSGKKRYRQRTCGRAIHDLSHRKILSLSFNCGGFTEEPSAASFSDMKRRVYRSLDRTDRAHRIGRGGTVFWMKSVKCPTPCRVKLLHVIQEKRIFRVGDSSDRLDIRIVAATNRDLKRSRSRKLPGRSYYRLMS